MTVRKHALAAMLAFFSLGGVAEAEKGHVIEIMVQDEITVALCGGEPCEFQCPNGDRVVFQEFIGIDESCNYATFTRSALQALQALSEDEEISPELQEALEESLDEQILVVLQDASPELQEALKEAFITQFQEAIFQLQEATEFTTTSLEEAAVLGPAPEAGGEEPEDDPFVDDPVEDPFDDPFQEDTVVLDSGENPNNNNGDDPASP